MNPNKVIRQETPIISIFGIVLDELNFMKMEEQRTKSIKFSKAKYIKNCKENERKDYNFSYFGGGL